VKQRRGKGEPHDLGYKPDDVVMVPAEEVVAGRRVRRWRPLAEKRRIVELTMEPGASVALVARAEG
jgi:transposase-like protein